MHKEKEGGRKETSIHVNVFYNLIYKDQREYAWTPLGKPKKKPDWCGTIHCSCDCHHCCCDCALPAYLMSCLTSEDFPGKCKEHHSNPLLT